MKGTVFYALLTLFGVSKSQYIAINPKPSKLNPCDRLSSTAHIERFFDLIFTEFHNTPPACVCIQMCAEQPTYCYPNGCLKRAAQKKVEEVAIMVNPVTKVNYEVTTKPVMYGVNHKAIVDDLLERPSLLMLYEDTTEKLKTNDLIYRPNPFQELVLKYKKVPKLEIKYNLREQVRNTKTEKLNKEKNIDISKTRWPSNKHLLHGKSPYNKIRHYRKNDDTMQTKFFVSMFPDYDPLSHNPAYYNKYLTKRENNNAVNVETLYVYQTDTSNFTLETLIDNLIENSLDKTRKDIRSSLNIKDDKVNRESTTEINFTEVNFLLDENNDTNSINNTAVTIVSMNSTNQNIDVNKYSHDMNMTNKNTVLEMIASMTKEIEKQNKASLEFMERATGVKRISYDLTIGDKNELSNTKATNSSAIESILEKTNYTTKLQGTGPITEKTVSCEDFTTTQNPVPVINTTTYKTKIAKQRIVRKLKRRKLN